MASGSKEHGGDKEWIMAKEGLKLLINNKGKEAEELFMKYPESLVMYSGYSFAVFMDALMSFEEDKLTKAITTLKEVERRCTTKGWFKIMKDKVFGTMEEEPSLTDTLETQIILADSQVCLAILVFLQQDISGYLKAGWVLRKAWKVYQSTYNDILSLYTSQIGLLNLPDPTMESRSSESTLKNERVILSSAEGAFDLTTSTTNGYILSNPFPHSQSLELNGDFPTSICSGESSPEQIEASFSPKALLNPKSKSSSSRGAMKKSYSVSEALSKSNHGWTSRFGNMSGSLSINYFTTAFGFFAAEKLKASEQKLNKKVIIRLMNSVTFGFGMLQLGVSLLPPTLLRLTSFLGLSGDRRQGLACLMYARLGVDMRAPLATLTLLWYHCIVRPFYALDGTNVKAGARVAEVLIQETQVEFGDSSLFLFFRGRLCRLNSDIPAALTAFQASVKNSTQREIKLLALHEVGWCYLIQLDFQNAESNFAFLATWSRWSRPFYSYISCICKGSISAFTDYSALEELLLNIRTSARTNQLDEFLMKRAAIFPGRENCATYSVRFWKLFVYEMLYLWNSLASCTKEDILQIISDCDLESPTEEPMKGVSKLIQGACYLILGRTSEARLMLRECIRTRTEMTQKQPKDIHILAFAQYELATILVGTPETKDEGRKLLQQTVQIRDYDFEERLTVRVSSLLRHG